MRADSMRDLEDEIRRSPSVEATDIAITLGQTVELAELVRQHGDESDAEIVAMRAIRAAWSVWSTMSKYGSPISISVRIPAPQSHRRGGTAFGRPAPRA